MKQNPLGLRQYGKIVPLVPKYLVVLWCWSEKPAGGKRRPHRLGV